MRKLRLTFENNADLYDLFAIAETLGKTVDQLLTGVEHPISVTEAKYWRYYFKKKAKLEEDYAKKNSKSPKDSSQPRMMGRPD